MSGRAAGSVGRRRRFVGPLLAVGGGLAVALLADDNALDRAANDAVARRHNDVADVLVSAGTDVGSIFGMTGVSAVLAAAGRPALALETAASGSLAWVVAQGSKELVDRRRPYEIGTAELLVSHPAGSSWPSGHAAVAAAMASTIAPSLTPAGRRGAAAVAAGVALSRLYVGAHHLTDVASGAALGALAADATRSLRDRFQTSRHP